MRFAAIASLVFAAAALAPAPALANVQQVSERGFVVRHIAIVPANEAEAWKTVLDVSSWWDGDHTFSGDAANLSLDPRPGGCFCEVLPNLVSPRSSPRGGVEHMRVVYIEEPRALRMTGALGPLQADAATGTLTIMLKPSDAGTQILLEYVVGGFFRAPADQIAPSVDKVLGEQMVRLAAKLGGKVPTMPEAAAKDTAPPEAGPPEADAPQGDAPASGRDDKTTLPLSEDAPPESDTKGMIGR